jgi:hypothetical protein
MLGMCAELCAGGTDDCTNSKNSNKLIEKKSNKLKKYVVAKGKLMRLPVSRKEQENRVARFGSR